MNILTGTIVSILLASNVLVSSIERNTFRVNDVQSSNEEPDNRVIIKSGEWKITKGDREKAYVAYTFDLGRSWSDVNIDFPACKTYACRTSGTYVSTCARLCESDYHMQIHNRLQTTVLEYRRTAEMLRSTFDNMEKLAQKYTGNKDWESLGKNVVLTRDMQRMSGRIDVLKTYRAALDDTILELNGTASVDHESGNVEASSHELQDILLSWQYNANVFATTVDSIVHKL